MKKRRTVKKKKMSTGAKIAIGVVVAGSAYAAWEFLIKPMIEKSKDKKPKDEKPPADTPQNQEQVENQVQQVIEQVQQVPANQAPKNKLSPIGTPFNKINIDAKVFYGDKGAEVVYIQKIANKLNEMNNLITGNYRMDNITTDGIYGKKTYAMFTQQFPSSINKMGITYKSAYQYLKQQEKVFAANVIGTKYEGTIASTIFKSQYE